MDDAKLKATRIVEVLQKNGLIDRLLAEQIHQMIVRELDPASFGELALFLTEELPEDSWWPKDYQEQFWAAWPKIRRQGKFDAMKSLDKIRKIGNVSFEVLLAAVEVYRHETRNKEKQHICLPATWLNGRRWEDEHIPNGHTNGRGEVKNGFLGRLMD